MALAAQDHAGDDGAGDVEKTLDVGVEHFFPVFGVVLVEPGEAAAQAGVVDEDVDFGPLLGEVDEGFLDGGGVADVEAEGEDVGIAGERGELAGEIGEEVDAAGAEQQARTLGGEGQGGGAADAGGGTGDEDDLVVQDSGGGLSVGRCLHIVLWMLARGARRASAGL